MLRTIAVLLTAAICATLITLALSPGASVDAGPLAQPEEAALKSCTARPWPYLNCVGTAFGNPRIRLVTTDRLPAGR